MASAKGLIPGLAAGKTFGWREDNSSKGRQPHRDSSRGPARLKGTACAVLDWSAMIDATKTGDHGRQRRPVALTHE